jgi:hypothetical protein
MTPSRMFVLAALTRRRLAALIACAALRTNLTIRELAASFSIESTGCDLVTSSDVQRRLRR